MLDQLELGQRVIARAEELSVRLVVGPVLEPEAIGLAPARPEERDQLVDLHLLLEPARDAQRPRASAQFTLRFSCPAPVSTTVVANSGPPVAP